MWAVYSYIRIIWTVHSPHNSNIAAYLVFSFSTWRWPLSTTETCTCSLCSKFLYIYLPSNKVVLDKYIYSKLGYLWTQQGRWTLWLIHFLWVLTMLCYSLNIYSLDFFNNLYLNWNKTPLFWNTVGFRPQVSLSLSYLPENGCRSCPHNTVVLFVF